MRPLNDTERSRGDRKVIECLEDRQTVRNVIYVLHALKLCQSWSVTAKNKGYEVIGMVESATVPEIKLREMELLKRVGLEAKAKAWPRRSNARSLKPGRF